MKTLTVRIVGGLGNQMHCYAFGRAVAAQNNAELKLDVESGFWNDLYQREYMLDQFPGLRASCHSFRLESKFKRLFFKCVLKLQTVCSRLLPVSLKLVVEEGTPPRYQPEIHRARYAGNPYFSGYWASCRYYAGMEKELRQELKPSAPTHPAALKMLSKIQSCRSCFIHWRSYNEEKTINHNLDEYYRNAVNTVLKKYPDIVFFVFSDDPAAAKKMISLPTGKIVYVDLPASRGNLPSLADFYLMYMCNHAVIGHSTFSWWAAWLGDREGKTTVFPQGISPWGDDWTPPHWIALDLG